jgi:predicted nucleotide-binding protein (sugar kinase/HSP70/actin superfamily)
MNRVCAAGTGSFLMEQADRLGLSMGKEFSQAAFSSRSPSDLGTRCTVFMESDLIHHQNNGASVADLSAGVCISIVRNYLERVANHKPLGERTILVGGVAANPAVRAAFELTTGRSIDSPAYFKVSGALGAALKVIDRMRSGETPVPKDTMILPELRVIPRDRFTCGRCPNHCTIDRYKVRNRVVFSGGRCDRWEIEDRSHRNDHQAHSVESNPGAGVTIEPSSGERDEHSSVTGGLGTTDRSPDNPADAAAPPGESTSAPELFGFRTALLESLAGSAAGTGRDSENSPTSETRSAKPVMGMIRSPQFYEWLPFWKAFLDTLGISLKVAPRSDREQFERGARFLQVETCLPMKVMAGQVSALVNAGVRAIFHPAILTEPPVDQGGRIIEHCPYVQASSQILKGAFDVAWHEPVISYELDPDAFRNEHLRFAGEMGFSENQAEEAFEQGMQAQRMFDEALADRGRQFPGSLDDHERALVVLGKPYHTSDTFLNMNLPSLLRSLGIKAVPGDLFPLECLPTRNPVPWKHQLRMIGIARAVARDPRLFPVMITFFGCGPDPFTMRHIKKSLKDKPLLRLEMDEHSSRAGLMTRLEAFLDHVAGYSNRADEPAMHVNRPQAPVRRTESGEASGERALSSRQMGRSRTDDGSSPQRGASASAAAEIRADPGALPGKRSRDRRRVDSIYIPYFGVHAYAFAAAARCMDVEAHVLPPPNEESARIGRPHLMGGECHPYALILGDYLKLALELAPERTRRSMFCIPAYSACRLGQYPVYIEQIRKELGHSMRVVGDLNQAMTAFGVSKRNRDQVFLRIWEGLTVFDVLQQVFVELRPRTDDKNQIEQAYLTCRDLLFRSLSAGNAVEGLENALHELSPFSAEHSPERPIIGVTGDYYTRVVSFANNHVYEAIEGLGGTVWTPPTFSDGLKAFLLQEIMGGSLPAESAELAEKCSLYASVALSEMRIKGLPSANRAARCAGIDPFGRKMRKTVSAHMDTRFPPGITAPFATALSYADHGADGILNLITLNCSYGTVVTAALARAMKKRKGIPLLTLIYDGLKKTNERTRLEAFMEQVRDQTRRK